MSATQCHVSDSEIHGPGRHASNSDVKVTAQHWQEK